MAVVLSILTLSLILNTLLVFGLFLGYKKYYPKKVNNANRSVGQKAWWVVQGEYVKVFTNEGHPVSYIAKGSYQPSIDRYGLNKATFTVYVNYAKSEEEMRQHIEQQMKNHDRP